MSVSGLFRGLGLAGVIGLLLVQAGRAQTRPAITGVAFVRVDSADTKASQQFYGKVLGYDRNRVDGLDRYAVNDSQWIEVEALPAPTPHTRVAAIGFTTRDAAGLERYIRAKGVAIVQPLKAGRFGIHDPEGRLVLFVQQSVATSRQGKISLRAGSHRIIHTGFTVKDREAEDQFYRVLLGFKPYWFGGRKEDQLDYVSLQVPDGTDWVEYMLGTATDANAKQLGGSNHISLGVAQIETAVAALKANGCEGPDCANTHIGRNGTMQLNVFDPDLTRVEYMEFNPQQKPCCSPFTGPHPTEQESR